MLDLNEAVEWRSGLVARDRVKSMSATAHESSRNALREHSVLDQGTVDIS